MSNELVNTNNATSLEVVSKELLVKFLNNAGIANKLTDAEKESFIEISQAYGLNPFKREIHASVYGTGEYRQVSFVTGYEVYLKRAERTGLLDGWKAETFGSVKDGNLKAVVTIYRKDRKYPFEWEVYYDECVQKTKAGVVTKFWEKANFMTKKVAMSQGFRLCFSDELGGMPYTADEMPQTEDISYTVVKEEPKVIEEPKVVELKAPNKAQLDKLCDKILSGADTKVNVIEKAKLHFTLSESDLQTLNACVEPNE